LWGIMLARMQNYISSRLLSKSFRDDDELYLFMISYVAVIFCLAVHIYLFALFIASGTALFIYYNIVSITIYTSSVFLLRKRKYTLVNLLIAIEVLSYTLISTYFLGIDSYLLSYYLLVIIMQVMIPYGKVRMRIGMIVVASMCSLVSIWMEYSSTPVLIFSDYFHRLFTISNVCLMMIGTVTELYIGNLLKQIISSLNKKRMEELASQANTDPLTGLYNRRYADLMFEKIVLRDATYCVGMMDIDDFKNVNDTYGHACGDTVLRFLSDFLLKSLRRSDTLFRWGGEEFLVLLKDANLETSKIILDKIRMELANTDIETDKCAVHISVTFGVAEFDPEHPYESIAESDRKLYQGKKSGKNVVVV
jgi:diguanylate cyclase (GGDEF)-like protein